MKGAGRLHLDIIKNCQIILVVVLRASILSSLTLDQFERTDRRSNRDGILRYECTINGPFYSRKVLKMFIFTVLVIFQGLMNRLLWTLF